MRAKIHSKLLFAIFIISVSSLSPSRGLTEGVEFHSSIKRGSEFRWKIETVKTIDNRTNWIWKWANFLELSQNDFITLKWLTFPSKTLDVNINQALNYSGIQVQVGSRILNNSKNESFFNFLIAPLYIINSLGVEDSGLNALERLWFNSYQLPSADLPLEFSELIWNCDIENGSLSNIGRNGKTGTIVSGHVTTSNFLSNNIGLETYVFDLAYDARTGIIQQMTYPSTERFNFPIANHSYKITEGLNELVIQLIKNDSVPFLDPPLTLLSLFLVNILLIRRRYSK
ncbi:MAG: hypothetical protein EAX86_11195 [Candidatus Heimdallarchaeota archaeon]|nr:hypothetical protein [Candidatus Heimdallarchaeota archaeon]